MRNPRALLAFACFVLFACGRDNAELARAQAEAEKAKAQAEQAKAEAAKAQAEAERAKAQAAAAAATTADTTPAPEREPARAAPAAVAPALISVTVAPQKANGKPWDAGGGAPDIAICVTTPTGTSCTPDGTSIGAVVRPACRDAFQCSFRTAIPPGEVTIDVVDVDVAVNDTIGSGTCSRGHTCRVGQAIVSIQ